MTVWNGDPLDSLVRGDCIVVSDLTSEIRSDQFPHQVIEPRFTGNPFLIMEVALPFISVWNGKERSAIDLRQMIVRKVSHAYARSLFAPSTESPVDTDGKQLKHLTSAVLRKRKKKVKKGNCKACARGEMRKQTLYGGVWKPMCELCGHIQGSPIAASE